MSENNKPRSFNLGNVKLTKWTNNESLYSYTFEKSYKDAEDKWQTSKSFNRDELLKLKLLIDRVLIEDIKEF